MEKGLTNARRQRVYEMADKIKSMLKVTEEIDINKFLSQYSYTTGLSVDRLKQYLEVILENDSFIILNQDHSKMIKRSYKDDKP